MKHSATVAHVPGKAIHKVILGAVRFVGDHDDDVAAVGKVRISLHQPKAEGIG